MSNNVGVGTIEKFDPENTGVAAGILFLSALELDIHVGGNSTPLDNQRKYFIRAIITHYASKELYIKVNFLKNPPS
jgi:hypothetical protein